jgi:hypothetical protein
MDDRSTFNHFGQQQAYISFFLDKGLQNPASTSMDVHCQLLQTKLGEKSKP